VERSNREADLLLMAPLLSDLSTKKAFVVPQDSAFFAAVAERCEEPERFFIHLIRCADRLVSAHIGGYGGDTAVYLLGATNEEGRASRAAYLAQWAAIETAVESGCHFYDLGGIDPIRNPDVYRFKRRMGGEDVSNGGTWSVRGLGLRSYGLSKAFDLHRRLKKHR
jgi:lipid II:glycine glycyltransferase (peptidoglycan interpeptide bridge formation enzyme)